MVPTRHITAAKSDFKSKLFFQPNTTHPAENYKATLEISQDVQVLFEFFLKSFKYLHQVM